MDFGEINETRAVIKSLIVSCPQEVTLKRLSIDFLNVMGYHIPYEKMGYRNLELFLSSLCNDIQVNGHGLLATVKVVNNKKSNHIQNMVKAQKKPKTSARPFKQNKNSYPNIKRPVKTVTRYIAPTALTNQSRLTYASQTPRVDIINKGEKYTDSTIKTDIVYHNAEKQCTPSFTESNQLSNLEKFFQKCATIKTNDSGNSNGSTEEDTKVIADYKMPQKQNNSNKLLGFNQNSTQMPYSNDINKLEEAVPKYAIDNLVRLVDFPDRDVTFGHSIPPYTLPAELRSSEVTGIYIAEVHNPFKFWFHIHKDNHELDTLMNQIEVFYDSLGPDVFQIPMCAIIPGEVCATLYNNIWHRGKIVSHVVNYKAKVFFVDYGTVAEVEINTIKYLVKTFTELSAQAMRGSLSHIKPRGLHWTPNATKHFVDMVYELLLYAQVSEIDEINRVCYMVLCDTNANKVIQINKALVEKGFAILDPQWFATNTQKQKNEKHKRNRHLREIFPTFSMIENGEYPTCLELLNLLEKGIDYERIIDSNLFHPGVLNHRKNVPEVIRSLPYHLLTTNPFRFDILTELNGF